MDLRRSLAWNAEKNPEQNGNIEQSEKGIGNSGPHHFENYALPIAPSPGLFCPYSHVSFFLLDSATKRHE